MAPGECAHCPVPARLHEGTCLYLSPRVFLEPLRPRFGISFPRCRHEGIIERVEWHCGKRDAAVEPGASGCDASCRDRVPVGAPPGGPATLSATLNLETRRLVSAQWIPMHETTGQKDIAQLAEQLGVTGGPGFMTSCPKDGTACTLRERLSKFASEHPPESTVFVMMHFPDEAKDEVTVFTQFTELRNGISQVLSDLGLLPLFADDRRFTQDLACNVCACAECSGQGVAVLAQPVYDSHYGVDKFRDLSAINYNVLFELGMMWGLGRTSIVLKHSDIDKLHTDVIGQIYVPYTTPAEGCEGLRDEIRRRQ